MTKIAMIHFHLNRGGVTHVIVSHLKALNAQLPIGSRLPVALVYGGRSDGWPAELAKELERIELSMLAVEELDYDNVRPNKKDLASRLQSTLDQAGFLPNETVIHVHNHALGKNSALPSAITTMAQSGYAFLLQFHDFAEDFRPENYRRFGSVIGTDRIGELPRFLYPQAPQVHYAVLNSRDHSILLDAGVDHSRLHALPNSVDELGSLPPRGEARGRVSERFGISTNQRLILYPVRGIRRKNLGEALLWSALAKGTNCFGLTLPPLNPAEQPIYAQWKDCATENKLRWVFEMGGPKGLPYKDNLAASDLILTTSVAEGFGLVFLETWLIGRRLVGRDLPEITADFAKAGIQFPGLGPNLWIPIRWLNEDVLRKEIADSFRSVMASYDQPLPKQEILDREIDKLICNGCLDFSHCGVSTQKKVIKKVASQISSRDTLLEANPWMDAALSMESTGTELIQQNAEFVRTQYSVADCGSRLMKIYEQVESSDRDDEMKQLEHGNRILERFLSLPRFHQLRVES